VEVDVRKVKVTEMVKKDRRDIAYIMSRGNIDIFRGMPYCLLPEVICSFPSFPVRMTRPSPYEDHFVMAMMRSLAAGALDKVSQDIRRRNFHQIVSSDFRREKVTKALSLYSFDAIFVVWLSGCGTACLVFVIECLFKQIRRRIIKN